MSQVEGRHRMPWLLSECLRVLASDGRALAGGLPALLAGGATLAIALYLWTIPEDQVIYRYLREASLRSEARDFDSALVCYDRLMQIRGVRPDSLYMQALILEEKGDREQSEAIFNQLAPFERQGYQPAHMKLARSLLGSGDRSERTLKVLERHLLYAQGGLEPIDAAALLGHLYAETGRAEQAEPYLLKAVDRQPEILLLLARLARDQGKEQMALERAEHACRVFQKKADERIDDLQARFYWASATAFRHDFPGAKDILERGLKLTGDARYHSGLADLYVLWADDLGRSGIPIADFVTLLERGLKHNAGNKALLDRLAAILQQNGPESGRVRSALQAQLASGESTLASGRTNAGVHFVLGLDANIRGKDDEARAHWEQAFRLDPDMAVVANNLAWVLAHANKPDLNRALELANRAIERQPSAKHFHATRGVVLMKLGRWAEALTDLEKELVNFPDHKDLHLALAQVYDHLGAAEVARQHRARAQAKSKEPDKKG
jgi:tetratricopeptide (TPR) repeat protein